MLPKILRKFALAVSMGFFPLFASGCIDILAFSIDGLQIVRTGEFNPPQPISEPVYIVWSMQWERGPADNDPVQCMESYGPGGIVIHETLCQFTGPNCIWIFDPVGKPYGEWTVKLIGHQDDGEPTVERTITFETGPPQPAGPVAKFTRSPGASLLCVPTGSETASVQLDGSASEGEGLSYSWFVDGNLQPVSQSVVSVDLSPGNHVVRLTVRDSEGDTDTLEADPFQVLGHPEMTVQGLEGQISAGQPITLRAQVSHPGGVIDPAIQATWSINGGNVHQTVAGLEPSLQLDPGTYEVSITATDSCDHLIQQEHSLLILGPEEDPPPADENSTSNVAEAENDPGLEGTEPHKDGEAAGATPPDSNDPKTPTGTDCPRCCDTAQTGTGDPVYLPKGLYYSEAKDLCQATHRGYLSWTRYYWSGRPQKGPLGKNWRHSFERVLYVIPGQGAIEVDERGGHVRFEEDGSGGFLAAEGLNIHLERELDGTLSAVYATQRRFNYRADGKLNFIRDIKGSTLRLTYSPDGAPLSVLDDAGRGFTFTVQDGRITAAQSSAGFLTTYAYSPDGFLTQVTDPRGKSYSYSYTPKGHLKESILPTGVKIQVAYDPEEKVSVVSETDPSGRVTFARVEYPSERIRRFIDPVQAVTEYEFDANHREIRRLLPDGRQYLFERDPAGRLTATHHPGNRLETWSYAQGKLLSHTSPKGETTLVERDPDTGRPILIRHPDGSSTERTFDSTGNLVSHKDEVGRVTSLTYTPPGEVASIVEPGGATTEFQYDESADLVGVVNALDQATTLVRTATGDISSQLSPGGHLTRIEYEGQHLVKSIIDALGQRTEVERDDLGRPTAVTSPSGARTERQYVWLNGQSLVREVKTPVGGVLSVEYDDAGRVVALVDELARRTAFSRDSMGRVIQTTLSDGSTLHARYNARGLLDRTTDALGRETFFFYDDNDQLVETRAPDGAISKAVFDVRHRIVQTIAADGGLQAIQYNGAGEPVAFTDALGQVTQLVYSPGADLVAIFDAMGRESSLEYDPLHRLTKAISSLGFTSRQEFDVEGNLSVRIDAGEHSVQVLFDPLNRPTEIKDPLGGSVKLAYDAAGNVSRIEDENGNAWTMEFDLARRKTKETDPNGRSVLFAYDLAGQLTKKTLQDGASIEFTWDIRGRLTQRVYKKSDGSIEDTHAFTYDAVGNMTASENSVSKTESTFDVRNRETLRRITFKQSGLVRTLAFSYDVMGRRTAMAEDTGRILKYTWDKRGQLLKLEILEPIAEANCKVRVCHVPPGNWQGSHDIEVSSSAVSAHLGHGDRLGPCSGNGPTTTNYITRAYSFTWDAVGNLLTTLAPNQVRTRRIYDNDHRLSEIVHERLSLSGTVLEILEFFRYQRDADGQILSITQKDGKVWSYKHDSKHQLTEASMSEALFRALGGHNHDGGHGSGGEDDDDDDGADIARVTRWTYDPAGNRIEESKDGRVTASTYSPANEILTAGPWRYENDLRGNQVSRQKGGGDKERFVYNVANMLMSYGRERRSGHGGGNDDGGHGDDDDDGQPGPSPGSPPIVDEIERYFYAPSFERVGLEDVKAGELTNFLWRDGRPIEEFVRKAGKKEDSAQGTRYSWALGLLLEQQEVGFRAKIPKTSMDFLLGEAGVAGKDREALLADHLGSIRLLTDDKGKVTERTTWGAWGELLAGGEESRFGFTGHQRESRAGQHYSLFRSLDSGTGRWTQRDPMGPVDGLNRYAYVGNEPGSYRDSMGLFAVPGAIIGGLLGAAYGAYETGSLQGTLVGAIAGAAAGASGAYVAGALAPSTVAGVVGTSVASGAAAGGAGSLVGSALSGNSAGDVISHTLQGAGAGAVTGPLFLLGPGGSAAGGAAGAYLTGGDPLAGGILGLAGYGMFRGLQRYNTPEVELPLSAQEEVFNTALFQESAGSAEVVQGFKILGNKGVVEGTFNRNIFYIESGGKGNLFRLIKAFETEAAAAGADRLSIVGHAVINKKLINPTVAKRLGYSFCEVNDGTISLIKDLR